MLYNSKLGPVQLRWVASRCLDLNSRANHVEFVENKVSLAEASEYFQSPLPVFFLPMIQIHILQPLGCAVGSTSQDETQLQFSVGASSLTCTWPESSYESLGVYMP
jgi:hypothetical protein